MIKRLLIIFSILLLASGSALSDDWEVVDIIDEGFKEGNIDHLGFRNQAVNICTQKQKFTFQFKGSDRVQTVLEKRKTGSEHIMRYFCSRSMMTKDPIMGGSYKIVSLLGKVRYIPNTLHWNNYSEKQAKLWNKNSKNFSSGKTMSLKRIKEICLSFGYTEGTEKFADCSKDLFLKNN